MGCDNLYLGWLMGTVLEKPAASVLYLKTEAEGRVQLKCDGTR